MANTASGEKKGWTESRTGGRGNTGAGPSRGVTVETDGGAVMSGERIMTNRAGSDDDDILHEAILPQETWGLWSQRFL